MKRLAVYTAVILATLAVMIVFWQFRSIIILLVISLVLSAALRPGFDWLAGKGVPDSIARLLVFLAVFGGLFLLFYLISGRLLNEIQVLSNYLVVVYDRFYQSLSSGTDFQKAIAGMIPAPNALPEAVSASSGGSLIQMIAGVTRSIGTLVAGLVVIIVLSLYWSADRNHFERLWLSVLPASQRIEARSIWRTTEAAMGAYLRSEMIQMLLAGLLLGVGYLVMGLAYPLLAALLGAVAWLVPMAGFVFIAGLSFLFGLASGDWVTGVTALLYTTLVLAFLEFVVEPRFFQRRRFSGLLIIFSMIILVQAYGLIGFIIAPPLAVALQVLTSHIARVIQRPQATTFQVEALDERLALLKAEYARQEEVETRKEIGSLLERLENLVDQARQESIPVD